MEEENHLGLGELSGTRWRAIAMAANWLSVANDRHNRRIGKRSLRPGFEQRRTSSSATFVRMNWSSTAQVKAIPDFFDMHWGLQGSHKHVWSFRYEITGFQFGSRQFTIDWSCSLLFGTIN